MAKLVSQLAGFRLTTAEIIYRLPDAPSLLLDVAVQLLGIIEEETWYQEHESYEFHGNGFLNGFRLCLHPLHW